ncbi:MAG: mechanosensitive ion channel domain-containing protein [Flavobacteriales bacterium]
MEDIFNIDLSQLSILNFIGLLVLAGFIYGFLWLFNNYLILLIVQSPIRRKKIQEKLPAISTLSWMVFSLYALYIFIKPFPFFGVLLSLIGIYLSRGYLINLINGLFVRLKGSIKIGQDISIADRSGLVTKMNSFDIEIENRKGELIQIPYGFLAQKEIVKKDFSTDFSSHSFSIVADEQVSESQIKSNLIQMPWVTSVFAPKVTRVMQSEGNINYEILVYSLDEKFHSHIENDLKRSLLK